MDTDKTHTDNFMRMSQEWMETSTRFWENSIKLQNEIINNLPSLMHLYSDSLSKTGRSAGVYNSINKFILSFFSEPDNLTTFTGASEVLPLLVTNISSNLMTILTEVQDNIIAGSSRMGKELKGLSPEDFTSGMNTLWKEMYTAEFQKVFKVPQLGIARNYQDQVNQTMDTGHQAMISFSEFMNLLYQPIEKAGTAVTEAYQKMMDEDDIPEDPQAIYTLWIKNLERYFMEMLQSPLYVEAMNNLINTLSEHKSSRTKLVNAMLQQLDIPSNAEMDELYREIYHLKKRLRGLEKQSKEGSMI